jgi:hypothetical protein
MNEILVIAKALLESRALPKREMDQLLKKLILQLHSQNQCFIQNVIRNEHFHYVPLQHNKPLIQYDLGLKPRGTHKIFIRKR